MSTQEKTVVTIESTINAPVEKVWDYWNQPEHITKWNTPSPDWHCPKATNDLRVGGSINARMEAKDGSFGFDFGGVYDDVQLHKNIEYTLGDGRRVKIKFHSKDGATHVVESFDAEDQNPVDFQKAGWQEILDNFKRYTESN